ncbi:hypothetical protein LV84_03486 [Algoriphagus ratkowskyi]|nr:hypothetical protein LV84_03486 [Algoriphagus ratkowskyi]
MLSSIGMAKSTHICMGSEMMAEFGLAVKHLDCGMNNHQQSSTSEHVDFKFANECCQNQFELVHNDADQNLKIVKIGAAHHIFIAAFTQTFIFGIAPTTSSEQQFSFFIPPPTEKDFVILFQSFLI